VNRIAVLGLWMAAVSCSPAEPEKTPLQRGQAMFEPAANQLGEAIVAEVKAGNEKAYAQYLLESGCANEAELGKKIGKEVLVRFGEAFSLSADQEARMKAGTFDDEANDRKLKATVQLYLDTKLEISKVCVSALKKYESGDWKKGLQLELVVRMLQGQVRAHSH
jgi:hypothetical protein